MSRTISVLSKLKEQQAKDIPGEADNEKENPTDSKSLTIETSSLINTIDSFTIQNNIHSIANRYKRCAIVGVADRDLIKEDTDKD